MMGMWRSNLSRSDPGRERMAASISWAVLTTESSGFGTVSQSPLRLAAEGPSRTGVAGWQRWQSALPNVEVRGCGTQTPALVDACATQMRRGISARRRDERARRTRSPGGGSFDCPQDGDPQRIVTSSGQRFSGECLDRWRRQAFRVLNQSTSFRARSWLANHLIEDTEDSGKGRQASEK